MIFKNVFKVGLFGLVFLALFAGLRNAHAEVLCSGQSYIPVSISISGGYGIFANSEASPSAIGSVTVPYGTVLSITYTAPLSDTRFESWPNSHSQTYQNSSGNHTHTTDALTSNTTVGMSTDSNCSEDPTTGIGGDVTVNVTVTPQTPVTPTVSLSASPSSVSQGQTSTLSWTSTNTTSCTATGGTGFSTGGATSGSDTSGILTTNTTFSISCIGTDGSTVTDSTTVTVGASSAPTATLTTSSSVPSGGVATLSWSSTNATSCTGSGPGFSTGGAISGNTLSDPLTSPATFIVTCNGAQGAASATDNTTITGGPVTGSCSVTPSSITTGQSATWSASPSGGNGTYTYSWSGTDSLSGTSQTIVKTYGTAGTKTGSVTISSNGLSTNPPLSCGTVTVSDAPEPPGPVGTCKIPPHLGTYDIAPAPQCLVGTPSSISGSGPWTWTCTEGAGTPASCIAYKTPPPPTAMCGTAQGATGQPPTVGTWCEAGSTHTGLVSSGEYWTWQCINPPDTSDCWSYKEPRNPVIWVTSNVGTTYTITGTTQSGLPVTITQSSPVTFQGHYNKDTDVAYTIHPASLSGYGTPTVAPSATQTLATNGEDITFAINYPAEATTGTVIVESNMATTWVLTGPGLTQTQSSNSIGATYQGQPVGTYTLSNVPEKTDYTLQVESAGSLSAGGTLTLTITYTPEVIPPGGGGPGVDLKVNASNGPVTVVTGSTASFTWTSSGVTKGSCVGSTNSQLNTWWDGPKSEENTTGEQSGVISATTTYSITCDRSDAEGATVSDSVVLGARTYACNDGYDNDGDGKVDYTVDLGCTTPTPQTDDSEEDQQPVDCELVPTDPSCVIPPEPVTQCSDGLDNDGDGKIDWNGGGKGTSFKDPGCKNAEDPSELDDPDVIEI